MNPVYLATEVPYVVVVGASPNGIVKTATLVLKKVAKLYARIFQDLLMVSTHIKYYLLQ